jgi:hypothetical protein
LLLFNLVLEILARGIRQEKEIKEIEIGRKKVKSSLFADNMILYIEKPKDNTKTLRTDKVSKLQDTKPTLKSIAFPYIKNELMKKK